MSRSRPILWTCANQNPKIEKQGANALSISADFSGKFVYVVLANNAVATFSVGSTGALTLVAGGGAPTGNGPGTITTVGGVQ